MNNQSQQTWEAKLSTILQDQKQGKAAQIALVFSLQKRWSQWAVTTYSIPMSSLPIGYSRDQFGVEDAIKQRVLSRTPSLMSTVESDRLSLMPMEALRAARLLNAVGRISWYSGYGAASSPALTEVLPLLESCLFYAGDEADPFAQRITVHPEVSDFGVDVSDDESGMTRIVPYAIVGGNRVVLSAGDGSVITETPLWVLADETPSFMPARRAALLLDADASGTHRRPRSRSRAVHDALFPAARRTTATLRRRLRPSGLHRQCFAFLAALPE